MDFIDSATKKTNDVFKYFKGKHFLSFFYPSNPIHQRWTIAVVLCLLLSIILAPDIHLFAPKYKIGMISPADIKADRDFLVEDQESTKQKKNDAGGNIRAVYDFDDNVTAKIKEKLARSFDSIIELRRSLPIDLTTEYIDNSDLEEAKKLLEQNLGFSLNHEEFRTLISHQNPVKLQNKLNRLIVSIYGTAILPTLISLKEKKKTVLY